jgi:hypothetical protein
MANEENLKPFKKGTDPRRNIKGRPKKYITLLKSEGYNQQEINDTIKVMLSMTVTELVGVRDNVKATILEKYIATAMYRSFTKGSLYSIETLVSRVFGKPKETAEVKTETMVTSLTVEVIHSGIPIAKNERDIKP